jgi:hypothetical protein
MNYRPRGKVELLRFCFFLRDLELETRPETGCPDWFVVVLLSPSRKLPRSVHMSLQVIQFFGFASLNCRHCKKCDVGLNNLSVLVFCVRRRGGCPVIGTTLLPSQKYFEKLN